MCSSQTPKEKSTNQTLKCTSFNHVLIELLRTDGVSHIWGERDENVLEFESERVRKVRKSRFLVCVCFLFIYPK